MPSESDSGQVPSEPLLSEIRRLKEVSRSALTAFKEIESRLAELEKQIAKSRDAAKSPGARPKR